MNTDYEVIIVGGRVAGSILAILLGRHGHRTLLLERAHFPSDTLSTHFFRWPALQAFQHAGVFDQVQATAPHLTQMFNDVDGQVFSEPVEGRDGLDYFLCVRRITLDAILARKVQSESSVDFRQGARMTDLLREDGRVVGARWTEENGGGQATARVVVGADGFYSQVAKLVEPKEEQFEPVCRAMYYSYFRGLQAQPGPAAEHHYRGNHLVYVFPTDDDLTLIAASVPIPEFDSFRADPEGQLLTTLESLPTLAPRLKTAERAAPVKGAGNIPCYQRVPYGEGWALVGDSGQVMDPWSGQGIDHAGTHAVILADSLHRWLAEQTSWEQAMSEYHTARNTWSHKTFERTRMYASDFRPMTHAALKRRGLA
jgi:2-polyprenyl-6-methoxyphenol hydroxylase-like FAD-dependent oxidoreductase